MQDLLQYSPVSRAQTQMSFICSPLRYLASSRSLPEATSLDRGCHMIVHCSAELKEPSLCVHGHYSDCGQAEVKPGAVLFIIMYRSAELTWKAPYGFMLSWLSVLSRRGLGRECHSGRSYANSLCFVVNFVLVEIMPLMTLGIRILANLHAWLGHWDYVPLYSVYLVFLFFLLITLKWLFA